MGRDLQNAKIKEIGRGLIGTGNFDLLPEFRTRHDLGTANIEKIEISQDMLELEEEKLKKPQMKKQMIWR